MKFTKKEFAEVRKAHGMKPSRLARSLRIPSVSQRERGQGDP
jgi:hypothetical protein